MSATTTVKRASAKTKRKPSAPGGHVNWLGADVSNGYFLLFTLVGVLCMFGLMMVLSSSSVDALRIYGSSWVFVKQQVIGLAVGGVALYMTLRMNYRMWRKWSRALVIIAVALTLVVLVPGIGVMVSGSRRWLGLGPLRFQPSEVAKFAMLVFAADLLSRRVDFMKNWKVTLRPVVVMFLVMGFLIMMEPDMGTTLVLASITITILWVAGTPALHMGKMLGFLVAGAALVAIAEPYRRDRLMSFTGACGRHAGDTGYQLCQSVIGLGSGGVTGVGLGASRAKWGFLPNAHTDFIFAIIGEELGLIGACAVVILFLALASLGVRAATRAPDRFGVLMASGITAWVVFQAFLNIGAVIGILPVTGVPLPFLSQGGTSVVVLMAAMGVLLNISREGEMLHTRQPRSTAS